MKSRMLVVVAAGAIALISVAGCNNNKKTAEAQSSAAVKTVNTTCPYTGEDVDPSVTAQYKGRTVAFCCPGCKGKWAKATDAQRDAMLAKAK